MLAAHCIRHGAQIFTQQKGRVLARKEFNNNCRRYTGKQTQFRSTDLSLIETSGDNEGTKEGHLTGGLGAFPHPSKR